jgi:hydroxyacylglutathione hydrolase
MNPDSGFTEFESKTENPHFDDVYDIDPKELQQKLETLADLTLIDVREPEEFIGELGHIANSELMSLATVPQKLSQVPQNKTVVFICRSGGRSSQASAFALSKGFKSVYNMRGGMLLWNQLALPTE